LTVARFPASMYCVHVAVGVSSSRFFSQFQFLHMIRLSSRLAIILLLFLVSPAAAQKGKAKRNELPPDDGRPPQPTPVDQIKVKKGFGVELLYSVPRSQGSWVSMCVDNRGRLIVCDQGAAGLFRITPPPIGQASGPSGDAAKGGPAGGLSHAIVESL